MLRGAFGVFTRRAARAQVRFLVLAMVSAALPASAADFDVTQKDKTFSVASLTVKVGDTLKIMNEDDVTHNITLKPVGRAGVSVDLGLQRPGETVAHRFADIGDFRVRCSIHPHMRMDLKVRP